MIKRIKSSWFPLLSLAGLIFPIAVFGATPEQIFAQASPSIVVVEVFKAAGQPVAFGSGVVIAKGQVITNFHLTQKGNRFQIRQSRNAFPATLKYSDSDRDLSQLDVPELNAPAAPLGKAKNLKVGQRVYAIGAPKGLELTLSEGLISSLRPSGGSQFIQTSAPISPGSSGSGLFDSNGRLIGITTFSVAEGQNLNFALPADWITELPERSKLLGKQNEVVTTSVEWVRKLILLREKGDFKGALELCQEWVKAQPNNPEAWTSLGNEYPFLETISVSADGKPYQKHIDAFREALRIDPTFASAWYWLGRAFSNRLKYDEAMKSLRQALRFESRLTDVELAGVWKEMGDIYRLQNDLNKALQTYEQGMRAVPGNAELKYWVGNVYRDLGKHDKAITYYHEVLLIEPKHIDALLALGTLYYSRNELDKAAQFFQDVVRYDPKDRLEAIKLDFARNTAWRYLGMVFSRQGKHVKAIEAFNQSIKVLPIDDAESMNDMGTSYVAIKQYDEATKVLLAAIKIFQERMEYQRQSGFSDVENKRKLATSLYNLGAAYYLRGDQNTALKISKDLREIDSKLADQFLVDFSLAGSGR